MPADEDNAAVVCRLAAAAGGMTCDATVGTACDATVGWHAARHGTGRAMARGMACGLRNSQVTAAMGARFAPTRAPLTCDSVV